ncbi:MAG TPA: DUF2490 domain-containing protein [Ferruginibacter sp.]|nr:DUF2490 domain-containing protein [Ferruginibacter sp.]HMP21459.1 DUF2490 domain-containing protein [Ferruginibacter sp.]
MKNSFYLNRLYLFAFIVTLFLQSLQAQQSSTHTRMLWFNYNHSISFISRWSILNDVQIRSRGWATQWAQFALRTEGYYRLNRKVAVGAGFSWFSTVRYVDEEMVLPNEWRPFEEVLLELHGKKLGVIQRLRLEQRFLQKTSGTSKLNAYEHRERLRYRLEGILPVFLNGIDVHVGNEVMANINYISDNRFFDQNRSFVIVNCRLSANTQFQFQYIKIFQWFGAARLMDNQDVLRFGIQQQLYAH